MVKIIDISEHNGNIDFKKVKDHGIKGVIIRLGWIGNKQNHTLDKKLEEYIMKCKAVGLPYGFYVYSYCKSIDTMKQGAMWTLNELIKRNIKPSYPIFIDMEDNTTISCGKENLTLQAVTFCEYIKQNSNFNVGVYANLNWFKNYLDVNKLVTYKIWLAQYTNANNHSANFKVDLWQYTSDGSVNGINTKVDINYCLNCENVDIFDITGEIKEEFELKLYQNGSTKETVYQDKNCTKEIGYLHPNEQAECYGIIDNKALIVYNIDNSNNKKTGFVKWLGRNKINNYVTFFT